jgi:hypothetical protein
MMILPRAKGIVKDSGARIIILSIHWQTYPLEILS